MQSIVNLISDQTSQKGIKCTKRVAKVLPSNLYTVAKGKNEVCGEGGPWGFYYGSCATGLKCVIPRKGQ